MRRYYMYYKRILHHKWLYFKYGKKFGVSLLERLTHNFGMLKPSFAKKAAPAIYYRNGKTRKYSEVESDTDYLKLIEDYKNSHPYYVDYWIKNRLREIPDKYLKQFIADRYVGCEMNMETFLISNRDLFFLKDSRSEPTYSSQVNEMLSQFILDKE